MGAEGRSVSADRGQRRIMMDEEQLMGILNQLQNALINMGKDIEDINRRIDKIEKEKQSAGIMRGTL